MLDLCPRRSELLDGQAPRFWCVLACRHFYLIFPLVVRLVPVNVLPRILIGAIIVWPLGRLAASLAPDQFAYYVLPQFRADVLSIGALVAWWRLYGEQDAAILDLGKRVRYSFLLLPLFWLSGSRTFHAAAWQHTLAAAFSVRCYFAFWNVWEHLP